MLSGCCGVLPEGVRRQIYIIRTSGARLLALINDVMDAAALRQNKLVLKQEQVGPPAVRNRTPYPRMGMGITAKGHRGIGNSRPARRG